MLSSIPSHPAAAVLRIALAMALFAAAVPAAASSAVIARSVAGFEGGPALASDGRVVVGERRGRGGRRIVAIDPASHVATTLASFAALSDPATFSDLRVAGTGGIITATLTTLHEVTDPGPPEGAAPYPIRSVTMALLPAPVALGTCASMLAAGGENFVATTLDDCIDSSTLHIRNPTGTITIHVQTGPADARFAPSIFDVQARGSLVAWTEAHLTSVNAQATKTAIVARAATGEVLLRVPELMLSTRIALGSDGTLVLNKGCR